MEDFEETLYEVQFQYLIGYHQYLGNQKEVPPYLLQFLWVGVKKNQQNEKVTLSKILEHFKTYLGTSVVNRSFLSWTNMPLPTK